jgi:hypothetical protein
MAIIFVVLNKENMSRNVRITFESNVFDVVSNIFDDNDRYRLTVDKS